MAVRGRDANRQPLAYELEPTVKPERTPAAVRLVRCFKDSWQDGEGRGPDEARRRLGAEGVKFDKDGRAQREFRVGWDVLLERQE
jgi:hypothetical protein